MAYAAEKTKGRDQHCTIHHYCVLYLHNMCENFRMPIPAPNENNEADRNCFLQPATLINQNVDNPRAHAIRNAIKQFLAATQPLGKSFFSWL